MTIAAPTSTLLDQLTDRRAKLIDAWEKAITARETARSAFERSGPTDLERKTFVTEEERFKADCDKRESEIKDLDLRIRLQRKLDKRRSAAARASAGVSVSYEPLTYRADNTGEYSYFRDLVAVTNQKAASSMRDANVEDAAVRLTRHAKEMDVEMPRLAAAREARALKAVEKAEDEFRRTFPVEARRQLDRRDFNPFERRVTPNRTDGQGGFFVPPLWLSEFIAGLRPGRVTANRCRNLDMPAGTDSINVPKLSTLTVTGVQGADNTPVASQDFTDTAVTANVKTIAGQSDVAIQLLEQSPYHMDEVLLTDLTADYDKQLDLQVVSGNGQNATALNGGQVLGLYSSAGASGWTGYNTVTYTTGSPAPWHMFSLFGASQSKVAWNRFLTGDSFNFVVHPRRGYWFAAGTDSNNRPLNESRSFPSFNVAAIEPDSVPAEGLVAQLPWGAHVYVDANVPTTDTTGGGSAQDVSLGAVFDDCWLFEAEMRTRVLPEVLSGTLAVRFQVYNYVAFMVRYGQSISIGSGTGFAAPTGAVSSITF